MAYPYPPYMQAHPPPGYGAPRSTGYFTTQNLGGFYAPISSNPPFAALPQPQLLGSAGSGGTMFNCWPGAPQEQEKSKGEEGTKPVHKTQRTGSREHDQRGRRDGGSKAKTKKKAGPRLMPWDQVVESLNENTADNKKAADDTDQDDNDNDDNEDDGAFDHCDYSASEACSGSVADSQTGGTSGDDVNDGVTEVVVQPGGSAHVFVHLNRLDRSPSTTAFVVSARRMQSIAHNWPRVCHQGTNDYDLSATDEAAVLGMYWLLQVLHMEVETPPEFSYYHGHGSDSDGTSNSKNNENNNGSGSGSGSGHLRPGLAPATTPSRAKVHPPAIPPELPARVLAYATLFAHQLGVLEGEEEHKLLHTNNQYDVAMPSSPQGPAGAGRFRSRAETWMRAVTINPRCRRTLDGAIVAPADWPYVLFTARVLGDRQLFAVCLRTLLERWWLNERGVFCDVNGPARIDLLPEAMREIVLRDLTSFKNARERSVESIVNGAMNAFY
ncbi:uncharacterized protein SPSK_09121 [Sporothrix schenckii 1099-18]|uniref:Uncharacterized protein n=1 Tax=Sporothrix schenckii 1099-18 TaxID=1397361 RepID=A0A0F2MA48_SPOSC|nr:uncharacterized protein SPSK_09121 [Sporothrix schenckii 1099-18]KJR85036.1 hypothetical protein SPSK_09121 [Sporothrix schenckii 1099-18]